MMVKKYFYHLSPILSYIFKVHLSALFFFFLIRVIFLLSNPLHTHNLTFSDLQDAFYMGLHFDNAIACFITLPPLLTAFIVAFLNPFRKVIRCIYNLYYSIIYCIAFGFSIADIPYYQYFTKHISASVTSLLQNGDSENYKMLLTETGYYKYYFIFLLLIVCFILLTCYFSRQWKNQEKQNVKNTKKGIFKTLLILALLIFFCMYGITRKYKGGCFHIETPYLEIDSFGGEASHNPVYYFVKSLRTPSYNIQNMSEFISEEEAMIFLREEMAGYEIIESVSPVCRKIMAEGEETKANIVIVLIESMSACYIEETPELTPFLNELKDKSYYFKNFYSTGTHTNQGIFSTFFGIPAFFEKNIMDNRGMKYKEVADEQLPTCEGLPVNLKDKGYFTSFFVAHSRGYDNMDVFLTRNGYDENTIFSSKDFPQKEHVNTWGVSDETLFNFAVMQFDKQPEPFFSTILTISNHPPYVIPEKFQHISAETEKQAVYYTDYCIKTFMEKCSSYDWFDNTIFVFLGDHGRITGHSNLNMLLSFNHIPLIIYSPLFEEMPQNIQTWGTQIDVFPTIMGLLNITYENNSLGTDLLKENRGYAVFSTDVNIGCINNDFLYSYNTISKKEYLQDYRAGTGKNLMEEYPEAKEKMRKQTAATVRFTDYMLKNKLTQRK